MVVTNQACLALSIKVRSHGQIVRDKYYTASSIDSESKHVMDMPIASHTDGYMVQSSGQLAMLSTDWFLVSQVTDCYVTFTRDK